MPPPVSQGSIFADIDLSGEARLVDQVASWIGRPVDALAVVAALEARGWRDADASARFGRRDLFDLGAALYPRCVEAARDAPAPKPKRARSLAAEFAAEYGRGLLYALPVVGQVAALSALGYSLWASVRLGVGPATMIGLSTIVSFIVTAAFAQPIAYEVQRLSGAGLPSQARRSALSVARLGAMAVLATAVLGVSINLAIPFYSASNVALWAIYVTLQGWLWLGLALLYAQQRLLAVTAVLSLGTLVVVAAVEGAGWGVHLGHAAGLAVAAVTAAVWGDRTLARAARGHAGRGVWPSRSARVHGAAPFALYGVLYFALIFMDRLVAWSAATDGPIAFPLWFQSTYELGIDWALGTLFVALAALPFAVGRLAQPEAKGRYRVRHRQHAMGVAAAGVVGAVGSWVAVQPFRDGPELLRPLFESPTPLFVFVVASCAYVALAVGLMYGLLYLRQGRPGWVLRPLAVAVAVDLVVGVVASRALGPEHAVWGLLAGTLWFAGGALLRAPRSADRAEYLRYLAT